MSRYTTNKAEPGDQKEMTVATHRFVKSGYRKLLSILRTRRSERALLFHAKKKASFTPAFLFAY
jgi:hypothetical protein